MRAASSMPSASTMRPDPLVDTILRAACCDLARALRVESISELVAELLIRLACALGFVRMAVTSLQLIGVENILKVPG